MVENLVWYSLACSYPHTLYEAHVSIHAPKIFPAAYFPTLLIFSSTFFSVVIKLYTSSGGFLIIVFLLFRSSGLLTFRSLFVVVLLALFRILILPDDFQRGRYRVPLLILYCYPNFSQKHGECCCSPIFVSPFLWSSPFCF